MAGEGDHLVVPGDYEARIYFGEMPRNQQDFWPRSTLIASTPFTVTYQAAPGALVLETAEPIEGEDIFIRLRLPPNCFARFISRILASSSSANRTWRNPVSSNYG